MKRKFSDSDEHESRLSQLLFNKTKGFTEKLKSNTTIENLDLDKKPVWIDEDDEEFATHILSDTKSKSLHTEKLKQKYETLVGTPNWAKLNKPKTDDDDDDDDEILRTVGHLQKRKNSTALPKDFIVVKRFPNVNNETRKEGRVISCVEFHPKASVALVGGQSGVASLFSIGGDVNNLLHSFRIQNRTHITAAHFTPEGSDALIASKGKPNYCVYNLVKAKYTWVSLPQIVKQPNIFQLSPNGQYLAVSDCFDEVYIICYKSKELIKTLKNNSNVSSIAFSSNSEQLYCYGIQGEVTIWNLSTFRALKKFSDQGCVTASCLAMSPCGRMLATGSGEGIVNVYETSNLTASEPIPLKTISHLRTKITNLRFNVTSEILSVSSAVFPNALKLVHMPSCHVFANFPKTSLKLQEVHTVSFSPNSGFMAIGNSTGCAYLYRLKHYKNY